MLAAWADAAYERKMAAATLMAAARRFTLVWLWSLCGETIRSENIALAIVAALRTANLVISLSP